MPRAFRSLARATGLMARVNLARALTLVAAAVGVGIMDDLQVRYVRVGAIGKYSEIAKKAS